MAEFGLMTHPPILPIAPKFRMSLFFFKSIFSLPFLCVCKLRDNSESAAFL